MTLEQMRLNDLEKNIRGIFSIYYVDIMSLHNKVLMIPISFMDSVIYDLIDRCMGDEEYLAISTFFITRTPNRFSIKNLSIPDVEVVATPSGACYVNWVEIFKTGEDK